MRNGLTKTLAAIAIACLGYQAFALAPVVRAVPNPVVTDDVNPVTTPFTFVYADYVNLSDYVSDDGPIANIVWSFQLNGAAVPVSPADSYRLNGAQNLGTAGGTAVAPAAAGQVNLAANLTSPPGGGGTEFNNDANVNTPTVRDINQSPYAGPNTDSGAAANAIMRVQKIWLWASDGTLATSTPLSLYTQKIGAVGSVDRLSGTPTPGPVNSYTRDFATSTQSWVQGALFGSTTMSSSGPGNCVNVTALGANIGEWISPYNVAPLVNNAVYRIRLTMTTDQTTPGLVPLWDMILENLNTNPASGGAVINGDDVYLADYFFLDNLGSANAIKGPATGLNQFDMWYAPSALLTPQWQSVTTGAFQPALDANNDFRLHFRLLDSDSAGIGGQFDAGTVCMTNISINRFDYSRLYTSGNADVYTLNPIISGISGVNVDDLLPHLGITNGAGSNRDFSTAPLTLTPADPAGWLVEITSIKPGDTIKPNPSQIEYGDGSSTLDNFPVDWQNNTLYQLLVDASAPDAAGETNGPDCIRLGFDTQTIEEFADSYMLSGYNAIGMPKQTTSVVPNGPQTYTAFFYGHNRSLSTVPQVARLAWRIDIINTDSYNRPSPTILRNLGGTRFHSIKVRIIKFIGSGL